MISLNAFSISGIFILATSASMAIAMLFQARNSIQRIWGFFCILVMMWGLGAYNVGTTSDAENALWWWKFSYLGVIFIPAVFIHFVHVFLKIRYKVVTCTVYIISIAYLISNLYSEMFISSVHLMFGKIFYLSPTPLYNSFVALFVFAIIYSHILLTVAYKSSLSAQRRQIGYFFVGSFIGFIGGSFSFLPVYSIDFYPYLNIAVGFYPIIMGYAIIKHKLMNLKVITTQLFVGFLWVLITIRAIIAPTWSQEQIFNISLLVLTIIIGIFLIRSVLKEVDQREKIEKLAEELGVANKRLKELDQMKSEFVSFATHQIRAPITSISGYASLILEGDYGVPPENLKDPLTKITQSSRALAAIVEDFLNISRIELGRMQYNYDSCDLTKLVKDVTGELKPNIEAKNLSILVNTPDEPILIKADSGKIRQVLNNLIDNGVKYTEKGSITVTVSIEQGKQTALLSITDTGRGIESDVMPKLFQKFSRADDARKANILGTGLGLYLAKELIHAHQGDIWAQSAGAGKGTTFFVRLPLQKG